MTPALSLALLLPVAASASDFLEDLHRAAARDPKDSERIEFATRAVREWKPADGAELLAEAHLRRAEGESAAYDDAAAEEDLTKALESDPRNDRLLFLRGRARLRAGDAAAAEKDFTDFTGGRPDDGEGWLGLAEARVARGLPRADKPALDAAAKAAKWLEENDPRPRLAEGRAHLAAGRALKALNSFELAAAAGGESLTDALAWRARAKAALGDPRGARADGGRAADGLERRLEDRRRARAPEAAVAAIRADLAGVRFRRGAAEETLSLPDEALDDYRLACDLGSAPACARVDALTPKTAAPAPKPPKRRRVANPSDDSGQRIYAN
jgi:hypothetical protein